MGEIQRGHITNLNAWVTNLDGGDDKGLVGGNETLFNQDEKYHLDDLVADMRCSYSPLVDSCTTGSERVPNTFMDALPNKESVQPTEY